MQVGQGGKLLGVIDGRRDEKPPNESNHLLGVTKRGWDEVGGWRDKERGWRCQDRWKRPPNKWNQLVGGRRRQKGRKKIPNESNDALGVAKHGRDEVGGQKDHPTSQIDSLGVVDGRSGAKNHPTSLTTRWVLRNAAETRWESAGTRRGGGGARRVVGGSGAKKTPQRV